ncbi:serine/threonine-protein kinase, partial [Mycobacterium simiae]
MSEEQASRAGSTFGPYHLKRLLGRGGMGEVYEAEHTIKEWTVAVKLMSDQFSQDPVFRERMKREARTAGRLQEPHVVPIHDYGEIDGKMFMEMRLVEGTDLDSLLKRYGPLTPPRAVAIITQVASALDAAHAAGVMHRDVKPPNILVTRDDFAYLVDFGIASATTDEKLTQLGTAVGTWKYMAPERFTNDEVTYRADIYALACVLHECLTGAPPYRADSAGVLVRAHMNDPIPQPSTVRTGIPKAFDAVIARGMAKKPEERYASAGDLALAAHEALSTPDQDHASDILRRSQEATLPGDPKLVQPPTIAGTQAAPPAPRVSAPPPPTPTPSYPRPGQSAAPAAP